MTNQVEPELKVFGLASRRANHVSMRRLGVKTLANHNTPDSKRLVTKLDDFDLKRLMQTAEPLLRSEVVSVNREQVLFELGVNFPMVDRTEVWSWRSHLSDVLEPFEFERLDWLWDMAWTFYLWPMSNFKKIHLAVYDNIKGPAPKGLDQPFQLVLSAERRNRIRNWERRVYRAAKKGSLPDLLDLGMSEENSNYAMDYLKKRAERS